MGAQGHGDGGAVMAERIQLSRRKGWRMPPNTVSVARPTKWGNPFTVGCNPSHFSTALPSHCDPCHADVLLELANAG